MTINKILSKNNNIENKFLRVFLILSLIISLWTINSASFAMEEPQSLEQASRIAQYRKDIIDQLSLDERMGCEFISCKPPSKYFFRVKWEGKTHCIKYLDLSRAMSGRIKRVLLGELERSASARRRADELYGREATKLVLLPSHHTVKIDSERCFMVMEWAEGESLRTLVDSHLTIDEDSHNLETILYNVGRALGELHYLPIKSETDEFFSRPDYRTCTHGDLTFPNIYYNTKDEKTYLIDFESYSEKGNHLFDLGFFFGCLSEHCKHQDKTTIQNLRSGFIKGYVEAFRDCSPDQRKKLVNDIRGYHPYILPYDEIFKDKKREE